jgi:hypothetical protein
LVSLVLVGTPCDFLRSYASDISSFISLPLLL